MFSKQPLGQRSFGNNYFESLKGLWSGGGIVYRTPCVNSVVNTTMLVRLNTDFTFQTTEHSIDVYNQHLPTFSEGKHLISVNVDSFMIILTQVTNNRKEADYSVESFCHVSSFNYNTIQVSKQI